MVNPERTHLWASALLLLVALHALFHFFSSPPSIPTSSLPQSNPILATKHGSIFLSQLPPPPLRGLLFIAHGCSCRPTFFWDKSPSCPHCIGLPEDRVYVHKALQKRYAVIAISSTGSCWSSQTDTKKVVAILSDWIQDHNLAGLPVFGLGASSGGYFLSQLALAFKFNAIVLMISEGIYKGGEVGGDYPPTLFVHMQRDEQRAGGVRRSMQILARSGVHTREIQVGPLPINSTFFSDRVPGLEPRLSEKIYLALKRAGNLDKDGYMQRDGRDELHVKWSEVLPPEEGGEGFKWLHHVREELNAAYGYHEMTSEPADDIFTWFEGGAYAKAPR